eukprot:15439559-Alexandrium_andersonii.AAC.1
MTIERARWPSRLRCGRPTTQSCRPLRAPLARCHRSLCARCLAGPSLACRASDSAHQSTADVSANAVVKKKGVPRRGSASRSLPKARSGGAFRGERGPGG